MSQTVRRESRLISDDDSIGAGAFFTLFIAKPNAASSELPMFPDQVASFDGCIKCFEDGSHTGDAVMCDKVCQSAYHGLVSDLMSTTV